MLEVMVNIMLEVMVNIMLEVMVKVMVKEKNCDCSNVVSTAQHVSSVTDIPSTVSTY